MFTDRKYKRKFALLMCNNLKGCQEDIIRLDKMLYDFEKVKKIYCYPKKEIENFLLNNNFEENDLLYIHYSGHGVKRGKKVNGSVKILTAWLNPDKSVTTSNEIDAMLSKLKCDIILTTDCCHSSTFGDFYTGNSPYTFIGTSSLNTISKTYLVNGALLGSLVSLFEHLIDSNIEINIANLKQSYKKFFKERNMQSELIIKSFSL